MQLQQQVEVHQDDQVGREGVEANDGHRHIHDRQLHAFADQQVHVDRAEDDDEHVRAQRYERDVQHRHMLGSVVRGVEQRLRNHLPRSLLRIQLHFRYLRPPYRNFKYHFTSCPKKAEL